MAEIFDLVDEGDRKIGTTDFKTAYRDGQRIRVVQIWVVNSKGEILLQRRGHNTILYPDTWDSSAGEHVQTCETYEQAAIRGLKEELSLQNPSITLVEKMVSHIQTPVFHSNVFLSLFLCPTDDMAIPLEGELQDAKFWKWNEIEDAVSKQPNQFSGTFQNVWNELNRKALDKLQHLPKSKPLKKGATK
ncbi:MAG: NUDIX domain-containing protein [Candidatus Diapherotrites archaeon]